MVDYIYHLPGIGEVDLNETDVLYLDFIMQNQLLNDSLWEKFVSAYELKSDDFDRGWRGEYWGKMMRGACLVYRCTANKLLFEKMRETVLDLLETAEDDGRISTYTRECECSGWDIWCRKYVLTGMLNFCDINPDYALNERILDCMERHLDCLIRKVGEGKDRIPICDTSDFWLGVNSCSILEPVLDLYKRRPAKRFIDFAEYIISTGGCSEGNLIDLAYSDEIAPFEYPERKAYETMSFFEGVLAYYEVTGKKRYHEAVSRFVEKIFETDITLIGCAGCTHELFDNSIESQTMKTDMLMQETCVTVTWMRLCARMFLLTGEMKYAERVEKSAVNALYGSVNFYNQSVTMPKSGEVLPGLPFDSYSPLVLNRRGRGVGGLKKFADGSFYGCCAAIGSAGLGLYPLVRSLLHISYKFELIEHRLHDCGAFTYGPYTLARDEAKDGLDAFVSVCPLYKNGKLSYSVLSCHEGETVRIILDTEDEKQILLTDYASCGKKWHDESGRITVWMPLK